MADETITDQYEPESRLHDAIASFEQARDAGQDPNPQEWLGRYPEVASRLAAFFADQQQLHRLAGRRSGGRQPPERESEEPETFPEIPGYQILELIGRGGMGVVYKARQLSAGRDVALKVIRPDRLEGLSPEERRKAIERFITEAQAAAKLVHENIVHVYEVGEVRGRPFYSMRYVVGSSLHDLIQQGPLEGRRAAAYLEKVARAVHEAHRHGILHRDLKPHNILVEKITDQPLVADFGLAKLLQGSQRITASRDIMGTPPYMSPEQAQGSANITVATDVYSLGATLYALLTGRPPFQAATPLDTILQVLDKEPDKPHLLNPLVHRDLETICLKCLEKEPRKRYASAEKLADRLSLFLEGKPIPDRPTTASERLWRWCQRNPALALACALAVMAMVTGTVVASYFAIQANDRAHEADKNAADAREQKRRADNNATEATAKAAEADDNRAELAHRLYISDMRLAQQAWENNQIGRLLDLLEGQRPARTGGVDLRGFEWHYWWRLCHLELLTLKASGPVLSVAFSPDGKRLASGSFQDNTIKLWDAHTGQEILTLKGHTNYVQSVAFSPDGKRLASGSADNTVKLWNAQTGQEIRTLSGHTLSVHCVAFSPEGQQLASASLDGTVKLWDAKSGQEIQTLKVYPGRGVSSPDSAQTFRYNSVAFSPDGRRLATGGLNHTIKLWDAHTGQEILTLKGHTNMVQSVAFSPDGKRLASGSADKTIKLWNAQTGQVTLTLKAAAGPYGRGEMAFSPDGQRLASASRDGTIKLWDAQTGQEIFNCKGHTNFWVVSVAFSPDGKRIASGSQDSTIKLWDAHTSQEPLTLRGHTNWVLSVAFSPDNKRIASGSRDNTNKLWDAQTGQEILTLRGHPSQVNCVAFSPEGQQLVSASFDGTIKLWNAQTGQETLTLKGDTCCTNPVAFSPNGKRIASGSYDHKLRMWDASTGHETLTLDGYFPGTQNLRVVFSRDGRLLAGCIDNTIKVWDAQTGQQIATLKRYNPMVANVASIAISPDGRRLAVAYDDRVELLDTQTGKETLALKAHTNAVFCVAFSPDGKRIASGSADNTVKLWDAQTGQEIITLKGHTAVVFSVAFSPDSARLASASMDGTVKLWDARPLTPEVKAEVEAVGLLEILFGRPLPPSEVRAAIQRDKIIGEPARQKALKLAELYKEETDPKKYDSAAWPVIRHPYSNVLMCQLALAQMTAACERAPDNAEYRIGLGVAQYRLGRFQSQRYAEALATLKKCDENHPTPLAFLAMTQHQLGEKDQARTTLARLRETMKKPEWSKNEESQGFLREAEALLKEDVKK